MLISPHLDNSLAGKWLFVEKVPENTGFRPRSYFIGESAVDKPQEVVALYCRLTVMLTKTMDIDQKGMVRRLF